METKNAIILGASIIALGTAGIIYLNQFNDSLKLSEDDMLDLVKVKTNNTKAVMFSELGSKDLNFGLNDSTNVFNGSLQYNPFGVSNFALYINDNKVDTTNVEGAFVNALQKDATKILTYFSKPGEVAESGFKYDISFLENGNTLVTKVSQLNLAIGSSEDDVQMKYLLDKEGNLVEAYLGSSKDRKGINPIIDESIKDVIGEFLKGMGGFTKSERDSLRTNKFVKEFYAQVKDISLYKPSGGLKSILDKPEKDNRFPEMLPGVRKTK